MWANLSSCVWIELRKATRSRVPLGTLLGFMLVPLACSFLMFIYKDPEFARSAGLISAKAELISGTADWPFFLNMLGQAMGIGGIMLYSLIVTWVFGREFANGTVKDLLAVPMPRGTILLAKFVVTAIWAAVMALMVYGVGVTAGALIGLPLFSWEVFSNGTLTLFVTALMVVGVITPFALLASAGRGYLLSIGLAMLTLAFANIIGLLGWGELFPWSIPALYAGMTAKTATLAPVSYMIVLLTCLAGVAGTWLWWQRADQNR